jgi:N utilization substance protein A
MKKEFILAFNELMDDKQLPREVILGALEDAMVTAYRKTVNASSAQLVQAKFDMETGDVVVYAEKEVVEDIQDDRTEVLLSVAQLEHPEVELGEIVLVEATPENFGRVAAQNARQVIQQRIREAERQSQYDHYRQLEGEIVSGIVQAVSPAGITIGLDRKAEGIMPRNQQIRGERYRIHDRVRGLMLEVKQSNRGPALIVSRAHKNFLRRLLEDEVPEIYQGLVEIRSIAREPGYRSKVAVSALQPGIDPVGACVGIKGVRIQAIVRELNDEKIDVIEWTTDASGATGFISKSLSPAKVSGVFLDETGDMKTATVVVPTDQLSLAIGRDGQNARLAAKLTGWRIDIKSLPEAASDTLFKLQNKPEFSDESEDMTEIVTQIEAILVKKDEGRVVTPEEYQVMTRFIDRVEVGASDRRQTLLEEKRKIEQEIMSRIPSPAFNIPLEDLDIPLRLSILLAGEGYSTIGEMMMQLEIDEDEILALNGIGPKAMESLKEAIENFDMPAEEEIVEDADVETAVAEDGAEVTSDESTDEEVAESADEEQDDDAKDEEADSEISFEEALETHEAEQETEKEELFTEDAVEKDPGGLFPEEKKTQKKKNFRSIKHAQEGCSTQKEAAPANLCRLPYSSRQTELDSYC